MGSEIVPSGDFPDFEQAIIEKDEHEGQQYMLNTMIIDLRGKNHVISRHVISL
jgi:hypothetical protein